MTKSKLKKYLKLNPNTNSKELLEYLTTPERFECSGGYVIYLLKNDKYHRIDGPAIESPSGYKAWYINGKLHRTDGPAIEYTNGDKFWYINGKLHRTDGPAIEYASGHKYWHINGIQTDSNFRPIK